VRFVQQLTDIRRTFPILRRGRFLTGAYDPELNVKDVTWIDADGSEIPPDGWDDRRCFGMRIDGRAQPTGIHKLGEDATMLIVFNAFHEAVPFTMPETTGGSGWSLLFDTAHSGAEPHTAIAFGETTNAAPRSLQLLWLTPTDPHG
jgi:glycogen operon protein